MKVVRLVDCPATQLSQNKYQEDPAMRESIAAADDNGAAAADDDDDNDDDDDDDY